MQLHARAINTPYQEYPLEVDSGTKIPCCTEGSNLRQQRGGLTLYLLSYIPTLTFISVSVYFVDFRLLFFVVVLLLCF